MNLTLEQEQLLRTVVEVFHEGSRSPFLYVRGGTNGVLVYENGRKVELFVQMGDFERLAEYKLIDLGYAANGAPKGLPTDAGIALVGTDFGRFECTAPSPVIDTFIQTMSGESACERSGDPPDEIVAAPNLADCRTRRREQLDALADQLTDALTGMLRGEPLRSALGRINTLQSLIDATDPDGAGITSCIHDIGACILSSFKDAGEESSPLAPARAAAETLVLLGGYAATCFGLVETAQVTGAGDKAGGGETPSLTPAA